jgi:hypothetical protein
VDHELPTAPNVHYAWREATLEIAAPLSQMGLNSTDSDATLDVQADTQFAGLPVDRTGYFAVALSKPEPAVTAVARGIDTKPATANPQ